MPSLWERLKDAINGEDRLDLAEYLTNSARDAYLGDPTTAGLVISRLQSTGRYWVAICRYRMKHGEGRETVVAEQGDTLFNALQRLYESWLRVQAEKSQLECLTRSTPAAAKKTPKTRKKAKEEPKAPRYGLRFLNETQDFDPVFDPISGHTDDFEFGDDPGPGPY